MYIPFYPNEKEFFVNKKPNIYLDLTLEIIYPKLVQKITKIALSMQSHIRKMTATVYVLSACCCYIFIVYLYWCVE